VPQRERGFTFALIGPDGAGKTSVARELARTLTMPTQYLYMGVNPDSSNRQLPTTRLHRRVRRALGAPPDRRGPRDPSNIEAPSRGMLRRTARATKSLLRLANQLAEEWYRQVLAWRAVRSGAVVIFDRHYFSDYYAYDVDRRSRSLSRRLHGLALRRLYPHPDLVVYLDAPASLLHARKGEGTIESLERRRHEYRKLASAVPRFAEVDASRPLDAVVADVAALVNAVANERAGRHRARD
jgi:thymidylate kinase